MSAQHMFISSSEMSELFEFIGCTGQGILDNASATTLSLPEIYCTVSGNSCNRIIHFITLEELFKVEVKRAAKAL